MIYLGDIHGNFNNLRYKVENTIKDETIFQVGDFGIGFTDKGNCIRILQELDVFLRKYNVVMYAIRGNHDDPQYFNGDYMYDNLKLLPDYSIIEVEGKRIIGVGGALSIDRTGRTEGVSYWKGEEFVLDVEKANAAKDIDIVVTHTCPEFCNPINDGFNWPGIVAQFMGYDETLGVELMHERKQVTELNNILRRNNNITDWLYGHFHWSDYTAETGCNYHLLDINELKMLK